jgi:hypothetical protein
MLKIALTSMLILTSASGFAFAGSDHFNPSKSNQPASVMVDKSATTASVGKKNDRKYNNAVDNTVKTGAVHVMPQNDNSLENHDLWGQ